MGCRGSLLTAQNMMKKLHGAGKLVTYASRQCPPAEAG